MPVTFEAWENTTNAPENLREFILGTKESKKTEASKKEVTEEEVTNSHYSAKNILNAPPRRITDWWLDLQRVLDLFDTINKNAAASKQLKTTEIHRKMVFAIGRVCYWAISEDHMLPTRERSTYRQALRINPAGIWELGKVVDAIPDIDRSYILFRLLSEVPNDLRASVHPASRIVINHGKGWIWRPGAGGQFIPPTILDPAKEPDYSAVSRFNEDSTNALMLLHDLLALGPDWQVMRQSVRINRPVESWAATVWRGGSKSRARIPWPAPAPLSYWEVDLFVHYWNEVVDECEKLLPLRSVEGTLQPLVYGWINAGQAIWHRRQPEETLRDTKENSKQMLHWEELAKKVGELATIAEKGDIRGALVGEWLWRLAYFLSPAVSGVTPDVVEIFARQPDLTREWKKARDVITGYHQEIITFLWDNKMNALAKQLIRAMNDHLKALVPEDESPSSH